MKHKVIFESNDKVFRILEIVDDFCDLENLKGDTYNPKVNTDIDKVTLKREEKEFEELVNREGVFGYVLEKWNGAPGKGYEHVDSCFGFVGQYTKGDKTFDHYIVDELKAQVNNE